MTLGLLQVQTDVSETTQHISISSQMLHIAAGCIALVCLLLILFFGSADALVSLSIFMDLFMTTILTPLAPTFTADYQLIALLTSSKNLVTCLIAPLAGHFVDNNEAKSMRLGMLCAMLCSLCFAMATWQTQLWGELLGLSHKSTKNHEKTQSQKGYLLY